jgi:hypothetical protein
MGKLVEIKTKATESSVSDFLNAILDEEKRKDSYDILQLMEKVTKEKAKLWGKSLIGFGQHRYKSPATGREVDWFKIGFSPRKVNFSLHLIFDAKKHEDLLKKLGKHKMSVGCLYITKLLDVDTKVLEDLIHVAYNSKGQ